MSIINNLIILAIELMNAEDTYKYKVTDLRSKVEYFFDRILLVNDKAVGTDYPFLRLVKF